MARISSCNKIFASFEINALYVGTPPSGKHVARTSQWHVARIIIRTTTIRIPLKICIRQFSYPDHLKERQKTFQLLLSKEEQTSLAKHRHPDNLHSASAPQYIRAISMCHPDIIIRIINQSKASLTRYHDSQLWPTSHHLQNEKTRGSDSKSLPTIILHDHFPRSLTAASPTMASDSRL